MSPGSATATATATDAAGASASLLYLHGFRSSPASFKAQRLKGWLAEHRPDVRWHCPQLPPSPREAVALMQAIIDAEPDAHWRIAGSSLGGFYATVMGEWLAAQGQAVPVVVINPAVDPARDLRRHIGELSSWHDPTERFFFRAEFVDELLALQPGALTLPARYTAFIATGDEVLDWQEMRTRYAGTQLHIIQGSDHALGDFDTHLPAVLAALGLALS